MTHAVKAGAALAAIAVALSTIPASAADLGGRRGMKDSGYEPSMNHVSSPRGPAGPCYFRGDVGYSVSRDPSVKWPVSSITNVYDGPDFASSNPANTVTTYTYIGDSVTNTSMENGWFGGIGLGCGMGSYGIRGEVMLNWGGSKKIKGVPGNFTVTDIYTAGPPVTPPFEDPLHTSVRSTTLMFNAYKDFGNWGGITPYLGAGVGVSHNRTDEVFFTDNPFLTNRIQGDDRLSLAWSLMAGIGWQVTDRAVLDFGYRYMNYGKAQSGQVDNAGFVNPRVTIDDIQAHEFKIGLRYHFGGNDCCAAPAYQPMK